MTDMSMRKVYKYALNYAIEQRNKYAPCDIEAKLSTDQARKYNKYSAEVDILQRKYITAIYGKAQND